MEPLKSKVGVKSAKQQCLALCPTAICVRREFGSLKGWVVFRKEGDKDGVAGAATAKECWEKALTRLNVI